MPKVAKQHNSVYELLVVADCGSLAYAVTQVNTLLSMQPAAHFCTHTNFARKCNL